MECLVHALGLSGDQSETSASQQGVVPAHKLEAKPSKMHQCTTLWKWYLLNRLSPSMILGLESYEGLNSSM